MPGVGVGGSYYSIGDSCATFVFIRASLPASAKPMIQLMIRLTIMILLLVIITITSMIVTITIY